MILVDCNRDPHIRRCAPYLTTINRLERAFSRLKLNYRYIFKHFSQGCNLFSSSIIVDDLNFVSNGKGFSPEQAKASAFAEMAERISAGLSFHKSLSGEIDGYPKSLVERVECFDYLNNYSFEGGEPPGNHINISELFSDYLRSDQIEHVKSSQVARHWVEGYSLTEDTNVMVPLSLIRSISGTNGLASGNVIEEAIIHGSNEIFERYVMREILTRRLELPSVDLNSIRDKGLLTIIEFLDQADINVIIKDCSFGGIFPCIGVVLIKRYLEDASDLKKLFTNQRQFRMGASFDLEEALMRCLTEYAQGYILSNEWDSEELWNEWFALKGMEYVHPSGIWSALKFGGYSGDMSFLLSGETTDLDLISHPGTLSVMKEIDYINYICKTIGRKLIIVDHTHPLIDFPSVRIIIPGLSDIIPFFDSRTDIRKLASFAGLNAEDNQFERFINDSSWTESRKGISELIVAIERKIQSYPKVEHTLTTGRYNRQIYLQEILLSLYLNTGDLRSFSLASKFLGRIYPDRYEFYSGLREMAELNRIEDLNRIMSVSPGCSRFLISKPLKNPFLNWCDEGCDTKCPERYDKALNQLIASFFIANTEDQMTLPIH